MEAARVSWTPLPSASELEASGFSVEDYEEEAEVWPENWPTFRLFSMLHSQWDVAPTGRRTGLKYPVLFELMDRKGIAGADWWDMLEDIRAMEGAALMAMRT